MAQQSTQYQPTNIELRQATDWPDETLLASITWPDVQFTYYVDSRVAGPGAGTATNPFKDLTSLPALAEGESIGRAYGSLWPAGQFIDQAASNLTIGQYGNPEDGESEVDGEGATAFGLNLTGSGYTMAGGIFRGATQNNGPISCSGEVNLSAFQVYDGQLHCLFFGWGTVSDFTAMDANPALNSAIVVAFTDQDGMTALIERAIIGQTVYDGDVAAIISHSTGGAEYLKITVNDLEVFNVGSGIALADCVELEANNVLVRPDTQVDLMFSLRQNAVIRDVVAVSTERVGLASIDLPNLTVQFIGGRYCASIFSTGISGSQAGTDLTFEDFLWGARAGSFFSLGQLGQGTLRLPGEHGFDVSNIAYTFILGRDAAAVLETPGHYVWSSYAVSLEINGATYSDVEAAQDDGYFLNSELGSVAACA